MDRAKRERKGVRAAVTRILNEADQELEQVDVDLALITAKLQRLDQLQGVLHGLDRVVLDCLLDADAIEDEMGEEQRRVQDYLDKIILGRVKINKKLEADQAEERRSQDGSFATAAGSATTRKFKLPKIELKKFSGDLKEWLGWWAQFSKIDDDEGLDAADKFQYLFQSTVEGSKAREVVDAYPQSAENYPKVIQKLQERFGKTKLLKQVYVRELLKLVNTAAKGTDGVSILYYALDSYTRSLASLGVTTEQSADFLYPMVESCLPESVLIVWQRHPNYMKDGSNEVPKMTELSFLLEFLRVEVENEEQRKLTKGENTTHKKIQRQRNDRELSSEDVATSAGLFEGKEKCLFCAKSNHQSHVCFKAVKMSLEEKRQKVKEAKGCYSCFKRGHGANACKAEVSCTLCKRKHYDFMCPENHAHKPAQDIGTEKQKQTAIQSSTETSSLCNGVQCGGEVLLKTIFVRAFGSGGMSTLARLLFDEGSQSSYVTNHLTAQVNSKPAGEERVTPDPYLPYRVGAAREKYRAVSYN